MSFPKKEMKIKKEKNSPTQQQMRPRDSLKTMQNTPTTTWQPTFKAIKPVFNFLIIISSLVKEIDQF